MSFLLSLSLLLLLPLYTIGKVNASCITTILSHSVRRITDYLCGDEVAWTSKTTTLPSYSQSLHVNDGVCVWEGRYEIETHLGPDSPVLVLLSDRKEMILKIQGALAKKKSTLKIYIYLKRNFTLMIFLYHSIKSPSPKTLP